MNDSNSRALRYMLGEIKITPQAHGAAARHGPSVVTLLERHARNDFGDVSSTARERNRLAATTGQDIQSRHRLVDGAFIVNTTNAERSETSVDVARVTDLGLLES